MKNKPIGIFDSGVGGLTVAAQVIKVLPNENIIYFGDTARFPYGTKSASELVKFTLEIVGFLERQNVKLVITACNSASAAALETAQEKFDLPILGVVEPGARAAVFASTNRRIGVIGTEATIYSDAYKKAIQLFDAGAKVFSVSCPDFASFVENGHIDGEHVYEIVEKYLNPLKKEEVDTLILGCTHYPLLGSVIEKIMGSEVKLINSAQETALEVSEILTRKNQLREETSPLRRFISTGSNSKFHKLGTRFLGEEIKEVETVSL